MSSHPVVDIPLKYGTAGDERNRVVYSNFVYKNDEGIFLQAGKLQPSKLLFKIMQRGRAMY